MMVGQRARTTMGQRWPNIVMLSGTTGPCSEHLDTWLAILSTFSVLTDFNRRRHAPELIKFFEELRAQLSNQKKKKIEESPTFPSVSGEI